MATSKTDPSTSSGQAKPNKVFDVAKPGKTAASASSRPLIVGHKAMLKDPMVNQSSVSELDEGKDLPTGRAGVKIDKPVEEDVPSGSPQVPEEETSDDDKVIAAESPSSSKINIKPPSEAEEDDGKVAVTVSAKATKKVEDKIEESEEDLEETAKEVETDKPAEVGEKEEEESKETEETAEKTEADSADESSDTDDSESEVKTGSASSEAQKKAEKEALEEAAKNEQLEKEVASGEYFVPIGVKTRKKRSLRHILTGLLLILLLGGALAYLMVDVGIIKANINLPYHFFKQENITTSAPVEKPTPTPKPTTTKKVDNGKSFSFGKNKLTYIAPIDWTVKVTPLSKDGAVESGLITFTSANYKLDTSQDSECGKVVAGKTITIFISATTETNDAYINAILKPAAGSPNATFTKTPALTTLGGQKAIQYQETPGECGWSVSTATVKDGYAVSVGASVDDVKAPYLKDPYKTAYESLIKSIKFE